MVTDTKVLTTDLIHGIIEENYPNESTQALYKRVVGDLYNRGYALSNTGITNYLVNLTVCNNTKNNYRAALQSVSGTLFDCGHLTAAECLKIKRVKRFKVSGLRKGRWLTKKQINRILNIELDVIGVRDIALLSVLFSTALRRSEISKIRWKNLYKMDDYLFIEGIEGKGTKFRRVIVQEWAIPALIRWHDVCVGQLNVLPSTTTPYKKCTQMDNKFNKLDNFMFSPIFKGGTIKFTQLSGDSIGYIIEQRSNKSGIRFTPHDTRRTCAYLLYLGGVNIRIINHILGHASISTTERYLRPIIESLEFNDNFFNI